MFDACSKREIVLASASPRRAEILRRAGIPFEIHASGVDESVPENLSPAEAAVFAAKIKAVSLRETLSTQKPIVACDTIVVLDNEIFGKPKNAADALRMLKRLSSRTHEVITGVCIIFGDQETTFSERTEVTFLELSEKTIESYIETGEPFDKAGAYGIQEKGMLLVKGIKGDYFNVVGLPIASLCQHLFALTEKAPLHEKKPSTSNSIEDRQPK